MNFGMKLAMLRTEKGYSQEKVACWLQVSAETVEEWEMGKVSPTVDQLKLLSEVFGVTPNELLGEEPIQKQNQEELAPPPPKKSFNKKILLALIPILAILIIGGLVAGFFLFSRPFSEDTNAIAEASASVVKILCYDYEGKEVATGSGFVFKDGKTIITNYHVIETAYTAKISTDQDKTYDIYQIVNYSKEKDIAILSLKEDIGLTPLKSGNPELLEKGDTVTAIGSPLGIKNTVSQGILSGRILQNSMDVLQFTAPISSGSSGGALFAEDGSVVGITFASYVNGQNLNLAIPINEVSSLFETKSLGYNLNVLYARNFPYVNYLIKYKDVEEVSFAELKQNPEKYNGKTIKLFAHLSSFREYDFLYSIYLAETATGCSFNNEYDDSLNSSADYYNCPLLRAGVLGKHKLEYLDINESSVGGKVLIIGTFSYHKKGEDLGDGLTMSRNYGSISSLVVIELSK